MSRLTCCGGVLMPRYHFVIHDDDRYDDPNGLVLLDDDTARRLATRVIGQLSEPRGDTVARLVH